MNRVRVLAATALIAALLLAISPAAHAFHPLGAHNSLDQLLLFQWENSDFDTNGDGMITSGEGLPVELEGGPSGFTNSELNVVRESLRTWGNVPSSFASFNVVGVNREPLPADVVDFQVSIAMHVEGEDDTTPDFGGDIGGVPGMSFPVLGVNITTFVVEDEQVQVGDQTVFVSGGTILDSDIFIDAAAHRPSPGGEPAQFELMSTLVHEVGHLLGLGHTPLNNLRPILADPADPESVEALVENEVFWMTMPDGTSRYVGATPSMFPVYFQVETGSGERAEGASTLAPDDISGISFMYPRGNQNEFYQISGQARTETREGLGLPTEPILGGHVVAWADVDGNPDTPRVPMFGTMTGLYEDYTDPALYGFFEMLGMWKQFEQPGTSNTQFTPTYTFTLNPLNGSGYQRQAPLGITPADVDTTHDGGGPYTTFFRSEVFHEVDNIADISNADGGTPLFWDFTRQSVVSADSGRTLANILANRPMFGEASDVCPFLIIEGGGGDGGGGVDDGFGTAALAGGGGAGPNAPGLARVRNLRDTVFLSNALGAAAVDAWYHCAPALTSLLIKSPTARTCFAGAAAGCYWATEHYMLVTSLFGVTLLGGALVLLRRQRRAAAALMLALFVVMPAADARIAHVGTEELAASSDVIGSANVISTESYRTSRGIVLTNVTVQVGQVVKGNIPKQSTISFTIPGGRVGNIITTVSEFPTYQAGDEMVLYLTEEPQYGWVLHGGVRGSLKIVTSQSSGDKYVLPDSGAGALALQEDKQAMAARNSGDSSAEKGEEDEAEKAGGVELDAYLDYLREIVESQETAARKK